MFAGSCIGILLLCIAIEAVRRAGREYDRRLIKQARVGPVHFCTARSPPPHPRDARVALRPR
jgi:hypothetical protein